MHGVIRHSALPYLPRTFGDGHLAREGAVEHPLHAVPEGGVAGTGGGPMKTPKAMGSEKPGIVAVTVLLAVAITDTVPAIVPAARCSRPRSRDSFAT